MARHIVSCVVQNSPLAFTRVAGLCAQRRYRVESIIGRPGETPGISLITLLIESEQTRIENAVKQLDRLIDVLRIDLLSPASPAACQLLLADLNAAVEAASCPA